MTLRIETTYELEHGPVRDGKVAVTINDNRYGDQLGHALALLRELKSRIPANFSQDGADEDVEIHYFGGRRKSRHMCVTMIWCCDKSAAAAERLLKQAGISEHQEELIA